MRQKEESTLSMECSDWAESFSKQSVNMSATLRFYAFKPDKRRIPGASYLGKFTSSKWELFNTVPPWQWHVAVERDGRMYDEIHSAGVDVNDYLNFFEDRNFIIVTFYDDLASAIECAKSWIDY